MESFILGIMFSFIGFFLYEKIKWIILKIWYKEKGKQRISIELQREAFMDKIIEHNKKKYDIKYLGYFMFSKYHYKAILIQKP